METKKCSKCGVIKELSLFQKRTDRKDSYRSECEDCTKICRKAYQQANKEKLATYQKKYRKDNSEELRKKSKQYRLNNIEKYKERDKQYYIDNKERRNKQGKVWYYENRDKRLNYNKRYYKENKVKLNDQKRKYAEEHVEEIAKYQKQYRKDNADEIRKKKKIYNNRPAKYKTYKDKLTVDETPRLSKDGISLEARCRYCGKYFKPTNSQVRQRVNVLKEFGGGHRFYCSKSCKTACPTYGMRKYPKDHKPATSREVSQLVRQLCFERDNYTCQNCGATQKDAQLHCHHLIPVAEIPQFADDVVNTTTLCKDCHIRAHKEPGMTYSEIRNSSC